MVRGVGFDFGGTLVPIIRPVLDEIVGNALLDHLGTGIGPLAAAGYKQGEELYWSQLGTANDSGPPHVRLLEKAVSGAGGEVSTDLIENIFAQVRAEFLRQVEPHACANKLLAQLAESNYRVGILSNWLYPTSWLSDWTNRHGLELTTTLGSADIRVSKPDPGAFGALLDGLGVKTEDMMFVGDSLREDIKGALASGIRDVVWITNESEVRALPGGVRIVSSLCVLCTESSH